MSRAAFAAVLAMALAACQSAPVKTEVIEVPVPVLQKLPGELTAPVAVAHLPIEPSNGQLYDFGVFNYCAAIAANCQLEKIGNSQPDAVPKKTWCDLIKKKCIEP